MGMNIRVANRLGLHMGPRGGTVAAVVVTSGWNNATANPNDGWQTLSGTDGRVVTMTTAAGQRFITGSVAKSNLKRWIELTPTWPGGGEASVGFIQSGGTPSMLYASNAICSNGASFNLGYVSGDAIRFEIDFGGLTYQAFVNGASSGASRALPASMTNLLAYGEMAYIIGPSVTVNTGQVAPTGTPTSGFVSWSS